MQYVLPKPATAPIREVPQLEEYIVMALEERQAVIEEVQDRHVKEERDEMIKRS